MNAMLQNHLIVASVLFSLGMLGFLTRRNLIIMFLSAELMLQGAALNFIAFSRYYSNYQGQSFTVFALTIAGCEAGIAMALILALYQRKRSLDVSLWSSLREVDGDMEEVEEPLRIETRTVSHPTLAPAGQEPPLVERKAATRV